MSTSVVYSSNEILDGIKNNNREVLQFVYKHYYPIIERIIVSQYKGRVEQAKDVFQDALLTIYTTVVSESNFKIENTFITLLAAICKRRMIDELRKNKKVTHDMEINWIEDPDYKINDLIVREEKARLFEKHFYKLGEKCRKLLSLFLDGHSIKAITDMLNMSSEQYTKFRRLQCKIVLFKSIYKDSTLKELIDGKPWTIREIPRW